jgi:hypothetical protein
VPWTSVQPQASGIKSLSTRCSRQAEPYLKRKLGGHREDNECGGPQSPKTKGKNQCHRSIWAAVRRAAELGCCHGPPGQSQSGLSRLAPLDEAAIPTPAPNDPHNLSKRALHCSRCVEVGYGVGQAITNQAVASEALRQLCAIALSDAAICEVFAKRALPNVASRFPRGPLPIAGSWKSAINATANPIRASFSMCARHAKERCRG